MNIPLRRTLVTFLLASAIPLLLSAGKGGPLGGAKSTCILSADFEAGIPAGWVIGAQVEQQNGLGNGLGTFVDAWTTGTTATASVNKNFPVPDVPAGNSFAMANDDAAPCNCAMGDVALTSPVFDLSGVQNTSLRFRAFNNGAFGGGDGVVEASSDASTWTTVTTIGAVANTWQWLQADLSAFDGLPSVNIRFRWSDNGGWAGGLAIDDICVNPRASHDLVILDAFLSDAEVTAFDATKRTLGYTQLPLEQGDMRMKAVVFNAGTLAALTVFCTVDLVQDGAPIGQFSSSILVISAGATDTIDLATWQPVNAGRVEATFNVTALSADDVPSDNGFMRSMWITGPGLEAGNNAMALDDSTVTGSVFNGSNDYAVAVRYEITRPGSSAYAVGFLPGAGSFYKGRVVGKVLDDQFNLLAVSAEHVLTQIELDDALTKGRLIYLPFDAPLALDADADVYAVLEHESDSGNVTVALSQAATHGSALLYDGPGVDWDYLLNVPIVRLYLSSPEVGLAEMAASFRPLSIAPNPADEQATVLVDATESPLEWSLVDLRGSLMLAGKAGSGRFVVPTAGLAAGSYVLQARTAGAVQVGRLVVVH